MKHGFRAKRSPTANERELVCLRVREAICLERNKSQLASLMAAESEIALLKKSTVNLGIERGLHEPLFQLRLNLHPREFLYSLGGADFMDVSAKANAVAREVAYKVERALIEFCAEEFRK